MLVAFDFEEIEVNANQCATCMPARFVLRVSVVFVYAMQIELGVIMASILVV